jgi:hypothetical protein
MSSIEKGNELLAELRHASDAVMSMAAGEHSEGERRIFRAQFDSTVAQLHRLASDLCEDSSGLQFAPERDEIVTRINEIQTLVRDLPTNPASVVESLPSHIQRAAEAVHAMMSVYKDAVAPGRAQIGTTTAEGFAPTLETAFPAPPIPDGWYRRPTNAQLIADVGASLAAVLRAAEGDNSATLNASEKELLRALLQTSLDVLRAPLLPRTFFQRVVEFLKKYAERKFEDGVDTAITLAAGAALPPLLKLVAALQ